MKEWLLTSRLRLRRWEQADLTAFCALTSDPAVMRWVGDGSLLSRELTATWIDKANANIGLWGYGTHAVTRREDGKVLGWAGLIRSEHTPEPERAEIIYALAPDSWGLGYATELAGGILQWTWQHTTLAAVLATVDPANTASLAVLAKLGFSHLLERLDEEGLPESHWQARRPVATV